MEKQSAEHPLARRAPDPAESRGAHDHLSIGRRLGEENGRLEGALAPADDDDACTREMREVRVLAGMARERGGKAVELRRPPRERGDPCCDDDPTAVQRLAVLKEDAEAIADGIHPLDLAGVDVGEHASLEPVAIRDEIRERDWPCDPGAALSLKGVERKRSGRITDVRRAPGAPEEHAARHVLLPERHRRSEHAYVDAALTKVRGCGEPVWPRTNHHDIRFSHLLPPPKAPLRVSHERTAKSKRVSASMSPLTASALRASRGQRHRRTSGPEERSIASRTSDSVQRSVVTSTYAPYAAASSATSKGRPSSRSSRWTSGGERRDTPTIGARAPSTWK